MKKAIKFLLPVIVLAACIAVGISLIRTAPKAERRIPSRSLPAVETITVTKSSYPVSIESQGTVVPRTESTLIPEVSGQIVYSSPNLRAGGFFAEGEVLLEIDPRNYENAMIIAQAELAQTKASLDEEKARVEQATRDWEVLNLSEKPNDLALRKPQLKSAKASVAAAEARLERAKIDLERTRIRAPYEGLVREKQVDVGQYVSPGNVLARIYAVDFVEIRLPLSNNQIGFVRLPKSYRGAGYDGSESSPTVDLVAQIGNQAFRWPGRIVRTEGTVDTNTQQVFVIAQVDDPYSISHRVPLKVGQFVEAFIEGIELDNVFILPRQALRGNKEVLIVDNEDFIQRRKVAVIWSDGDQVVINKGLAAGERVSMTALPFAISGTKVQVNQNSAAVPSS